MPRTSFSLAVYLLVSVFLPAQSPPVRPVDPFFLIEFNPAAVRFDAIPTSIPDRCLQLKDYYVQGWVYAHARAEGADYFVVDGYVKVGSEEHPGTFSVVQEDGPVIIELRQKACSVDAAPYIFFPELNPQHTAKVHISDKTLARLSSDLLQRYAKAFGGKSAFLQRIQEVKRDKLPTSLRCQLEIFEKAP
jgi:hypothetical protein